MPNGLIAKDCSRAFVYVVLACTIKWHAPSSVHMCDNVCVCVCLRRVVWFHFVRTSQQLNATFCKQFLHLCTHHQVSICVCGSSARSCDLSLSEEVTSQQLNATFCKQFLHLCMHHQVSICVCLSSARSCDLSLSELVTSQQLNAAFCKQFLHLYMHHVMS